MQQLRKFNWLIPVIILVMIGIVLWISPEERTLGTRIKIVYIHVAFVWAGLIGISLTGLLSSGVFWQPTAKRLQNILPILSLTGVICFVIGFLLSLVAAKVNWGGIAWTEPRAIAATRIIAVAVIVQILAYYLTDIRIRGGLYIGLLLFTIWTQANMRDVIHPTNPIFTSDSNSFTIAVLSLFALVMLLAIWFIVLRYQQVVKAKISLPQG